MGLFKRHSISLFFIVLLAFALHLFFLGNAIPFLASGGDPFDQYVKFQRLLYSSFRDWNIEWSWLHGLGGDLIGQFSYYYSTSLFFLVKLFFSIDSFADLAKVSLYVSIGKAIFAGTFFYFYMISCNRTRTSAVFGALIYIGSIKFMQVAFFADFMADAFVFLPLVIWGLDRLLQEGKTLLFILMIFLIVQSNFYFAYITTIYIGVHTIIYVIAIKKEQSLNNLMKKILSVGLAYLVGLLLAAYSFFPAVYQFLHAYRFSKEYPVPLTFPVEFYLNMPAGLFFNITMITIPAIIVLLLMAAVQFRTSIPSFPLWTALVVFIFYQIPFMYSVFNGFSAMESRWTYLLIFTIAIVSTYTVDEWLKGKKIHVSIFILYYCYLFYAMSWRNGLETLLSYKWAWIILLLHFVLPVFLLVHKRIRPKALIVIVTLLFGLVSIQQSIFFESLLKEPALYKERITKVIESYDEAIERKEVFQWLQNNDPSFSRYASYLPYERQVANFSRHNNNMIDGVPGLSSYHSLLTNYVGKFIYEDFRIKQFDSFSHFYNVDERLFLQTYLQANYIIVNKSFNYVPDGYSLVHTTGGFLIYQLDVPIPFAYVENNAIDAKDLDTLSIGARDMLLLQAYQSERSATNTDLSTYNLPITLFFEEIPFQESSAFIVNENVLILEDETSFTIPLTDIPIEESQLLASFTIQEVNGGPFVLKIEDTAMEKREDLNRYSLPIKDFAMHIDESIQDDELTFTLSKGSYRLSNLRIEMLPFEQLKVYQEKAVSNSFELVTMNKNKVTLSGTAKKDGMLVTSIPYSKGWNVKIDGKKAKVEKINTAFVGIPLKIGDGNIELTYHTPFLRTGVVISLFTLFIIIFIVNRIRKR